MAENKAMANQWSVSWQDLSYKVPLKKNAEKVVIAGMNGAVKAGEMVAILGGSGAGKSTLLNCISGRLTSGTLTGKILLNGHGRKSSSWKKICCYVEQDDLMYINLTVYETLLYSAKLRLPSSVKLSEKKRIVDDIIMQLGLNGCRDTRIGDRDSRGISGGERKRVSIGIELVTNPQVLFLDEPTSGLDAFNALNVMEIIKRLAVEKQKVVLMTIHQPRTDILELMNKIILLSAGKTLFYGPLSDGLKHFSDLGYSLPDKTNPSDFFLDIITTDQRSEEKYAESLARIDTFHQSWEKKRMTVEIIANDDASKVATGWPSTWFGEFFVLLDRNLKDVSRDKATLGATLGQGLIICLLMGFLFWQVKLDASGVQNRIGFFFFLCINQTFGVVMPTIGVFPIQRTIIKRERSAGTYRASSAYLAKAVSTFPLVIAEALLLTIPTYWMVGFQNVASKYLLFIFLVCIHSLTANSLGLVIGSIVPNPTVGQIFGPLIIVLFLLFGGQLVNLESLPVVLRWIQYISPIAYSNKALAQNEFEGLSFQCNPGAVCYETGKQVLSAFAYDNIPLWTCVAINVGLMVGFLIIGFAFFQRTSRPSEMLNVKEDPAAAEVKQIKDAQTAVPVNPPSSVVVPIDA